MTNNEYKENTFHQLSPYLGKLKSNIAKKLILSYTKPYDTICDPFSGSGTVALESLTLNRHIIANDINPYAVILTKAKMYPPNSLDEALERAEYYLNCTKEEMTRISLSRIPKWVRTFFHPTTLKETLSLVRLLKRNEEYFILACVLGILHHQSTGFLSYPSSHIVPYLRTEKFPKERFPTLYTYRDIRPRLLSKIKRVFRHFLRIAPMLFRECKTECVEKLELPENSIDAVITSPPYMDTLSYGGDNRLRLWFLGINDYQYYDNKSPRNPQDFHLLIKNALSRLYFALKSDSYCIFVVGEVKKGKKSINTSSIIQDVVLSNGGFKILSVIEDEIPYSRRIRGKRDTIKKDWFVIMKKEK
ncbi:MAG: DNA methyltransferase [bacterium]